MKTISNFVLYTVLYRNSYTISKFLLIQVIRSKVIHLPFWVFLFAF